MDDLEHSLAMRKRLVHSGFLANRIKYPFQQSFETSAILNGGPKNFEKQILNVENTQEKKFFKAFSQVKFLIMSFEKVNKK